MQLYIEERINARTCFKITQWGRKGDILRIVEPRWWIHEGSLCYFIYLCAFEKFSIIKLKNTNFKIYKELKAGWFSRFFFSLKIQNHSDLILLFSLSTASLRYNLHPYNSSTVSVQFIEFQLVKQLYNHYNSDLILNQENFFFGWELFYFFNFLLLWK